MGEFEFDQEVFSKLLPKEYLGRFVSLGLRPDNRSFLQFRTRQQHQNPIKRCFGSSTCKIGNSTVVCGIKAEIAEPLTLKPREGFLVPNIDLPALCSGQFKPGPPGETTQAISEFINQVTHNSAIIDLNELCIKKGKAVWVLYCDMICINYDGSIIDCCIESMMSALACLRLPRISMDEDTLEQTIHKEYHSITINRKLSSFTFGLFEG
jgi:exosome complex component RRP43